MGQFRNNDAKNLLYVRIDRKRKFLATIFLRALGLKNDEDILRAFYTVDKIRVGGSQLYWQAEARMAIGARASSDIDKRRRSGSQERQKDRPVGLRGARRREGHGDSGQDRRPAGAYTLTDLVNTADGEHAESNIELTPETIAKVIEAGIETIEIFFR